MAATTLTELWELAATLMGASYATEVVDAAAPTTALEQTMSQVYDQIRTGLYRRADWQFARRYESLREAPKSDPFALGFSLSGRTLDWDTSGRFRYVYRTPADSLKFRGFQRDWGDANLVTNYIMRRIPVEYETLVGVEGADGVYTFNVIGGRYAYGTGSCWIDFFDGFQKPHAVYDDPAATTAQSTFEWKNEDGGATGPSTFSPAQYGVASNNYLVDTNWSGVFWGGLAPATMNLVRAVRPNNTTNWSNHIFTDQSPEMLGVYTSDITDVSAMPSEFQLALAAELAFQAGIVHAKSTKQLQLLQNQAERFFSTAVSASTAEEESLDGQSYIPTAEQARW